MRGETANKWMITVTVMTGTVLSALDASIVNVALPYMRGNLGASVEEITWVATGYMLSNVITMPLVALLSSRFGRKRFYVLSVILFTASSILCGTARHLTSLVVFRIIQGIGGGALIPIAQAILRETFPLEEQGMAMGIYGLGVVMGPAFGPTLGGWLTDHYAWPWIFYVNVPIGMINLVLVSRYIQDPPYLVRERGRIDLLGVGLLAVGLGALQVMLERGEQKDWFSSTFILYLAVVAAVGILLFVWRELVAEKPAVDLRVLRNVTFATGTMIGGVLGMGLYGTLFLMPLLLEQLLYYPAFDAGLALMPRSLAMAVTMPLAGSLYNRAGPRLLIGLGLAISAFSFWELSRLSLEVGFKDIVLPQFVQGVGFGMIFVSLSTVALSTIEKQRMQAATGLYNVVRLIFGSVGIAVFATQLEKGGQGYRAILVEHVTGYRDTAVDSLSALSRLMVSRGADLVTAQQQALGLLSGEVTRQALMLSYNRVFFLVACLFIVSAPLIVLLRRVRTGGGAGLAVVE